MRNTYNRYFIPHRLCTDFYQHVPPFPLLSKKFSIFFRSYVISSLLLTFDDTSDEILCLEILLFTTRNNRRLHWRDTDKSLISRHH